MSWIGIWLRVELRTRGRSLLTLALLVAASSAVVMTAVAAAHRGSTAIDRLLARTAPATIAVLLNEPGFDWTPVRELPGVAALTTFAVADYAVDGVPPEQAEDVVGFAPADREVWRSIERPVVLAGRLPDPARADEVVVTSGFPATFGRHVGDKITLRLFTPEQADRAPEDAGPGRRPEGPAVEARIVGVVRSPWFKDGLGGPGMVFPSPGLFQHYEPNLLGSEGSNFVNALVRLERGSAGIPDFKRRLAAVTGRSDLDFLDLRQSTDHMRDVARFDAGALLAFAAAAAIASAGLIGQAVARYAGVSAVDLDVWNALGFSRRQSRWAASAGPTIAALAGTALGASVAVGASPWFPRGIAGLLEPSPGVSYDVGLLIGCAIPGIVSIGLWSAWSATRALGRVRSVSRTSPSWMRSIAAAAPVPVAVGTRFALDPGRGRRAVPVRSAILGAIMGVAGVIGALTFSAGVNDATDSYARFGQTYDLVAFFGFNGVDFAPSGGILEGIANHPDVRAVNDARMDVARSGDHSVSVYELAPLGTGIDVVLRDGRLPRNPGEILLGPHTAQDLGLSVGDHLTLSGSSSDAQLAITGIAFTPSGPHNDYDTGGWVTRTDYDRLFHGFKFHFGLADVAPGRDAEDVAARLAAELDFELSTGPILPPSERDELRQIRVLPTLLAAFLTVLALGAIGHTLGSTVSRRRGDLAMLRTLGMTRRAVGAAVVTQATIIAVAGFIVGIPLGAAIGRVVWAFVAGYTPVDYLAPSAWLAIAVAPVAALLAANLLAAWPAWRVRRLHLATALRVE